MVHHLFQPVAKRALRHGVDRAWSSIVEGFDGVPDRAPQQVGRHRHVETTAGGRPGDSCGKAIGQFFDVGVIDGSLWPGISLIPGVSHQQL